MKECRCLKYAIRQIDSKDTLSASYTAKLEVNFALTLENYFS